MTSTGPNKTSSRRTEKAALRRTAIINSALDEFVEKGFAAARVQDIARRAGVAKGTIYLNFSDKEALFEAIVKQEIRPRVDAAAAAALAGGSLRDFVELCFVPVLTDLAHSRRGAVIRLLIGEAGRFPQLAEVYYRVVIEPGVGAMQTLVQRAIARGELEGGMLLEFPQLIMAPAILAVIWTGLFDRFRRLDVERMAHAYFDQILRCAQTDNDLSAMEASSFGRPK